MQDILSFENYNGFGVFTTQIVPGSFQITGEELNYATCGVCPRIFSTSGTNSASIQSQAASQ